MLCDKFIDLKKIYSIQHLKKKGAENILKEYKMLKYMYIVNIYLHKRLLTLSAILNEWLPWWSPASAKHWNVQCVPYGQKINTFK